MCLKPIEMILRARHLQRVGIFVGVIVFTLFTLCGCNNRHRHIKTNGHNDVHKALCTFGTEDFYCCIIDSIEYRYYTDTNVFDTFIKYIGEIEKASGISSTASMGTAGISYNDSTALINDAIKWRAYFKCK